MSTRRQLLLWGGVALATVGILTAVVRSERKSAPALWTTFLVGDPQAGSKLFFGAKRCSYCHAVSGSGGKLAPDLGFVAQPTGDMSALVTTMWNHAPQMWGRMRSERIPYPNLNYEEMADLFAFLYTTRYLDEPGDSAEGRVLFRKKGCIRCHSAEDEGGSVGPSFSRASDTPIRWTEALWNHAPMMAKEAQKLGVLWPEFCGREANDVLAYIREVSHAPRRERELLPADRKHGWDVFQKACIDCHRMKDKGGSVGPDLSPNHRLALSFTQFAGLMWNHAPRILRNWQEHGAAPQQMTAQEVADLLAFLGNFEPNGSAANGESRFKERGCAHCHGDAATGTRTGPPLRGHGVQLSSIVLATALWEHGPKMFQRTQQLGVPWPKLVDGDVGDLVAFLNSPVEKGNQ